MKAPTKQNKTKANKKIGMFGAGELLMFAGLTQDLPWSMADSQ